MPRARRSAGNAVLDRAQRFSDALLVVEEATFKQITVTLSSGAAVALSNHNAGWKRGKGDPKAVARDYKMFDLMNDAHLRAVADTRDVVSALARTTVDMALESIEDELLICESSVGGKYAGITDLAVKATRDVAGDLSTKILTGSYVTAMLTAHDDWNDDSRQQTQFSSMYADDQEHAQRRLFSALPVNAQGCGGRGVWWRTSTTLNAGAREVAIRLSAQVRTAAMQTFNDAAAAR